MPTITLNKKIFEQLVGKELPLEELKDRISMLGTDLESIEGNKINVEIFPNRPDLLSEQGLARAFSSFIGVKTGLKNYSVKKSGEKVIIDSSVLYVRPYIACAIVKGLEINDEKIRQIIQIQEKLHITYGRNRKKVAIGIYPMEKIKFPITYKAENPNNFKFKPLESHQEMTGLQILSQHNAGKEFGHLLEGLNKFSYFIDNDNQILSMPPIINSELTGRISEKTKDIFVECSGFNYNVLSKCLNIIVTSLADMGGKIYSLDLVYSHEKKISPNLIPEKMRVELGYINRLLGLDLDETDMQIYLERMGFGYQNGYALIPSYRADILHQIDLVEDIAIAYGYENFNEEFSNVATIGVEDPLAIFINKIREILIGLKLLEVKNYHLITKEELNSKLLSDKKVIALKNSLGDYNHLRNNLLSPLLKTLVENQHHEYPQNIFEIGKIFFPGQTETGVVEEENLAVMFCHEKTDFTEIKQTLDVLINSLGLDCSVKETLNETFIFGRVGNIFIDNEKIGTIGEINPQVLINFGLVVPTVGFEINLDNLFKLARKKNKIIKINKKN